MNKCMHIEIKNNIKTFFTDQLIQISFHHIPPTIGHMLVCICYDDLVTIKM